MLYQTPIFIFTVLGNQILAVVCIAICCVVLLLQHSQDSKSRAFALLIADLGLFGIFDGWTIISAVVDPPNVIYSLEFELVFLAAVPLFIFIFAVEYLGAWTRAYRTIIYVSIPYIAIVAFMCTQHLGLSKAYYLPDATLNIEYSNFTGILLAAGVLESLYTFYFLIREGQKQPDFINLYREFVVGVVVLNCAAISYAFDVVAKYSVGTTLFAIGSLILVRPVLRQRFTDPLKRANDKLMLVNEKISHQSEQFRAITYVSQQTTSLLEMKSLLQRVVNVIQQTFSYYAVSLFLPDSNGDLIALAASDNFEGKLVKPRFRIARNNIVGSAAETLDLVSVEDVSKDKRFIYDELLPDTASEVAIPLLTGGMFIGVLDIQSNRKLAFSKENLEVLQILAHQTAIVIRNAQLFEAKEVAEAGDRAKSQFLANMSHELRLPLTVIGANTYLLLEGMGRKPLEGIQLTAVHNIDDSSKSLLKLVEMLLDLSKIEAGQVELKLAQVDLVSLVQKIIGNLESLAKEKNLRLTVNASNVPALITTDVNKIDTIVSNLVGNAIKFTDHGSVEVKLVGLAQAWQLEVIDTGIGIPHDQLENIFDNFYQVESSDKRAYQGTGIGLAIVKRLVSQLGGEISVVSESGIGSGFRTVFPFEVAHAESAIQTTSVVENHQRELNSWGEPTSKVSAER